MNFPFGFIQWHSQSQQMLSTKYRIPWNPGSSMLCEVKGRKFLKSIGNKTFFNLSCPFFLGCGHCSLSFWPFKSVGSTKGGGGTADIVTSASFSITSLLSLFMSLSEIVLQSPSKELFYWKILKYFKKAELPELWEYRHLQGKWAHGNHLPISQRIFLYQHCSGSLYHNKWGANLITYIFNCTIDFFTLHFWL